MQGKEDLEPAFVDDESFHLAPFESRERLLFYPARKALPNCTLKSADCVGVSIPEPTAVSSPTRGEIIMPNFFNMVFQLM
jgi:hypothetical protein